METFLKNRKTLSHKQLLMFWDYFPLTYGNTDGSTGKESACKAVDPSSVPGLGRSPGEGNGYPLQYSYLGNPTDRGRGGLQPVGSHRVRHD